MRAPLSRSWKRRYSLRGLRQFVELRNALGGLAPAFERGVARLDGFEAAHVGGNLVGDLAVDFIADADGNLVELVEHVELGNDQPLGAVDLVRVAEQRNIEPAAAAGRPVTAPYSWPRARSWSPTAS